MIIKTKESASWLIGAVAGICTAVAMVATGVVWWLVVIASLLVYVAVSLFALWVIVYNINDMKNGVMGEIFK